MNKIIAIIIIILISLLCSCSDNRNHNNYYFLVITKSDNYNIQQLKDTVQCYANYELNVKIKDSITLSKNELTNEYFGEFVSTDNQRYSLKIIPNHKSLVHMVHSFSLYIKKLMN